MWIKDNQRGSFKDFVFIKRLLDACDVFCGHTLDFHLLIYSVTHKVMICILDPWSNGYQCEIRIPLPGLQFPACARSRMLTLGKLANLNHTHGGLLLD